MKEVRHDLIDQEDTQRASEANQNLCKKKWKECLNLIEGEIPWQTFETWFSPIIPISYHENIVTLRVSSQFVFEWLESHFSETLHKIVQKVFGKNSKIEYLIAPSSTDKQDKIDLNDFDEDDFKNSKSTEEQASIKIDSHLNPQFTFSNFFVYRNNKMVKKAAEYISMHLDRSNYNPSFYYGDKGTGKTHLLNAIGNDISTQFPDKKITFLSSERFLHEYVCSLQNGKINDFKEMLTNSDVFLLDDIHYFSNKMSSQENLFYVISQLLNKNKRIVVTSALPPSRLPKFNSRLISIFQRGLIVDLVIPEHNARNTIIRNFLKENRVRLSDEVIEFLSEKCASNMHTLNSVLVRIVAQISFGVGGPIGLQDCRMIMSHLDAELQMGNGKMSNYSRITVDKIIRAVCAYFDIPHDVLTGSSRHVGIVSARQMAMYISRKYTGESLASIGYHFGDRNHTSVLYACNKIQQKVKQRPELRFSLEEIVQNIIG